MYSTASSWLLAPCLLLVLFLAPSQDASAGVNVQVGNGVCGGSAESDSVNFGEFQYADTSGGAAHASTLTPHRVNAAGFAQMGLSRSSASANASAQITRTVTITSDDPALTGQDLRATLATPSYRMAEETSVCDPVDPGHRTSLRANATVSLGGIFSEFQRQNTLQPGCDFVETSVERTVTFRVGSSYTAGLIAEVAMSMPFDGSCTLYTAHKARKSISVAFGGIRDVRNLSGVPVSGIHVIANDGTDYTEGVLIPATCDNDFDDDVDGATDFPSDGGCSDLVDKSERKACGLGAELIAMLFLMRRIDRFRRR